MCGLASLLLLNCVEQNMNESKTINLESLHRFQIDYLTVEYALMGMTHVFPFDSATVTVALPGPESISNNLHEFSIAHRRSYREEDHKQIILTVDINAIQIEVKIGDTITLPSAVLKQKPHTTELIPEADKVRLKAIGERVDEIAHEAFEYWISIMRWRCDNHRIGRPPLPGPRVLWQNTLRDTESKCYVWSISGITEILMTTEITATGWAHAQTSLQAREEVPVYILLLDDARENLNRHDYRRSIIDLAIACEVFMRMMVLRAIPENLDADMRAMIEGANINQYLKKFLPNLLTEDRKSSFRKLANDLGSLFDLRNKIMHMADSDRATKENCVRFIKATATLFETEKTIENPSTVRR